MFTDYIAVARGYITGCAVAPALLTASNDSSAVGFMTQVACRLTAKNQDHFRNPALQVYSSSQGCHIATGTRRPHGITQCYLPPAITPAEAGTRLSDPGGMQG